MLLPLNPLPLSRPYPLPLNPGEDSRPYPLNPLLLPEYDDTGRNNDAEDEYIDAGVLEVGMYRTGPALLAVLAVLAVAVFFFFLRPKTFNNFFFRPMYE